MSPTRRPPADPRGGGCAGSARRRRDGRSGPGGWPVGRPGRLGPDPRVIDLDGRPVLAGLVDQHCHLFALGRGRRSLDLLPEALAGAGGLTAALHRGRVRPTGWVATRGGLRRGHQRRHRCGHAGCCRCRPGPGPGSHRHHLDPRPDGAGRGAPRRSAGWPDGVERDGAGHPTGRLFRLDAWLRTRLDVDQLVDLAALGRWLAARGVTTVVDASATNDAGALRRLAEAGLPQRVVAMTADPDTAPVDGVTVGAVKILLDDADLPTLDDLTARVTAAHAAGRQVAVHCVTAVQLVLALSARAGAGRPDRARLGHRRRGAGPAGVGRRWWW